MFHVEHSPPPTRSPRVDMTRAARGRQWENDVQNRRCSLRQNTCKSDQCQVFFAGVRKIILDWASLSAPVQSRFSTLKWARRRLYAQCCDLSSLFAGLRAIYFDWAGLATGTIIWYNLRKPRNGCCNLGKFWKIWAK